MTTQLSRGHARWAGFLHYFDLTTRGQPSFSKLVCLALLVVTLAGHPPPLGIAVALLAASFGRSVFLALLNKGREREESLE